MEVHMMSIGENFGNDDLLHYVDWTVFFQLFQ